MTTVADCFTDELKDELDVLWISLKVIGYEAYENQRDYQSRCMSFFLISPDSLRRLDIKFYFDEDVTHCVRAQTSKGTREHTRASFETCETWESNDITDLHIPIRMVRENL